jgi:hypothetical protein
MKIILERVKKGQTNEKWTLATDALELSSKSRLVAFLNQKWSFQRAGLRLLSTHDKYNIK